MRWACRRGAVGSDDVRDYVLSIDELRFYAFPTPRLAPSTEGDTNDEMSPRVFGLDCEMVTTTSGSALARVSLVELVVAGSPWPSANVNSATSVLSPRVLLDVFVRPALPVIDFVTRYSGVTRDDLDRASIDAAQAREMVASIVRPFDILCGHDLANDLIALGLSHARVIDTVVLYPHHDGPPAKRSLEAIAIDVLHRRIQVESHSSIEDAVTALELARMRVASRAGRLVWSPLVDDVVGATSQPTMDEVITRLGLRRDEVRCVYLRGSRAVGYAGVRGDGSASDWDFVIVTAYRGVSEEDVHVCHANVEGVLYDERTFLRLVQTGCIWALECIFAPSQCVLVEEIDFRAEFSLYRDRAPRDAWLANLRRSVSYESGRKWGQARRYLVEKGDAYSARKRMFIAMRFVVYGIEIARTGSLADISCANDLWRELCQHPATTWPELRKAFESKFRELRAAFHRVAPKLPRYGGARMQFQSSTRYAQRREERLVPIEPIERVDQDVLVDDGARIETVRWLRAKDRRDPIGALRDLQGTFDLGVRQHARNPNIVQLRYTPTSSPRDHAVVRECRGLILDASRAWEILAYPFDRFFNLEELSRDAVSRFDASTARVLPKLDGSLAVLYAYEGEWRVASSRRPDASGLVGLRSDDGPISFEALFWSIWQAKGYALPPVDEGRWCFMFELTTRRHPIVVRYSDDRLTLIGARDLETLREAEPGPIAARFGWEAIAPIEVPGLVPSDVATMMKAISDAARSLDASMNEGFVLCDASFHRIKVKSPDYVRLAWLFPLCAARGQLSERRLIGVLVAGERDEFLAYCPEHRDALIDVEHRLEEIVRAIECTHDELASVSDPKAFAEAANRHVFADALFSRRFRGMSTRDAVARVPLKTLARWISPRER